MKAVLQKVSESHKRQMNTNSHHTAEKLSSSSLSFSNNNVSIQRKPSCPCGGGCPRCRGVIQPKLMINQPGDIYEQEADRVAEQVLATKVHHVVSGAPPRIQRFSGQPNGQMDSAPASVDQALASPGRPLEPALRQDMEQRFGYDFSRVRVHTDGAAEQSARDVNAKAYTVDHDIVFGDELLALQAPVGRRLLAHELTHVVQQSELADIRLAQSGEKRGLSPTSGLLQRDPRQTARDKVVEAMEKLKKKYYLGDVTEEHGATWSESELVKVDAAFSKLTAGERTFLYDLRLIRTDKFEPLVHGRKTFQIAGRTTNGRVIQLTRQAFEGDASTLLHEVGHVIQARVAEAVLEQSQANRDLKAAAKRLKAAQGRLPRLIKPEIRELSVAVNNLINETGALLNRDADLLLSPRDSLEEAKMQADIARLEVDKLANDPGAKAWIEVHNRVDSWVNAVEKYVDKKATKNLTDFVALVNKHKLATKGFAPFTDYVAAHWPDKPGEFFAESYAKYRKDPAYLKEHARPLFDWFAQGGHLTFFERHGVMGELARELKETFWPAIENLDELLPAD